MSQIQNPLMYIGKTNTSKAAFNGSLYFANIDTIPVTNGVVDTSVLKTVSAVQENGNLVPISQPVPTNQGGYPTYNGSPVVLDVDGDYAFQAFDSLGVQIAYVPRVTNSAAEGFSGVVITEEQTLTSGQTQVTFSSVGTNEAVFFLHTLIGDQKWLNPVDDFTVLTPTVIELTQSYNTGDKVVARQNDPTGQVLNVNPNANQLLVFDALADAQLSASTGSLKVGDTVTLNEGVSGRDGGDKYIVQLETETNDNVNYLYLDGTIQLKLHDNYYRFVGYSEKIATATISSGILNINLDEGMTQQVTLTEDVTSWNITGGNPDSDYADNFTIKIQQDGTGGRGVVMPSPLFTWSGGTAPTMTSTADAIDRYGFTSYDGHASWSANVLSQDES